ncbi:MAG: hypothetical protein DRJ50_10685 [Actinobacteria bacterium]|nr:MAG: hypothetical protein DRJ50_10685 [Actinomycetota bacterium]
MTNQELYKFPSIGQFRNAVKDVRHFNPSAKIPFQGTVKVHGTNAAVVIEPDGSVRYQSRSRIITPEDDNFGFAAWAEKLIDIFKEFTFEGSTVVLHGEFAGKGIQKGVAISDVEKFFYIFAAVARYPDGTKVDVFNQLISPEDCRILLSTDVYEEYITIDFAFPEASQNKLAEMTEAVEKECPVGKWLGVSGAGEGIVWAATMPDWSIARFKVKGQKHSVSKVKELAQVDPEKVASVQKFIEYAATEGRLEQALQEVCEGDADRGKLGAFLKWVSSDVNKEEADVLETNGLTMKDVGKALSIKGREWFFAQESI